VPTFQIKQFACQKERGGSYLNRHPGLFMPWQTTALTLLLVAMCYWSWAEANWFIKCKPPNIQILGKGLGLCITFAAWSVAPSYGRLSVREDWQLVGLKITAQNLACYALLQRVIACFFFFLKFTNVCSLSALLNCSERLFRPTDVNQNSKKNVRPMRLPS